MTREERYICKQQKELFEYAKKHFPDVRIFAEKFMESKFCNRSLDQPYSVDQFADIMNWLEFLEMEFPLEETEEGDESISLAAAGWIGFVYRELHFATGLSSRELVRKVPFDDLNLSYAGLHTVDEDMAMEIIAEDFRLPMHVDCINQKNAYVG